MRHDRLQAPCGNGVRMLQTRLVSIWQCGCYEIWKGSAARRILGRGDAKWRGNRMKEQSVRLGPREKEIVELLLQGCDNAEIAAQLKMARRTVKAHFNRLFLRFGINSGIKRVKLATTLYRRQLCLEESATENAFQTNVNSESSSSLRKGLKTAKLQKPSARVNMS